MNTKISPLLCSFLLASSLCASQADPIDKELDKIDAMPDHEVICLVIPYSQNEAEESLPQCKETLKNQSLHEYERVKTYKRALANKYKTGIKYHLLKKEIVSCNNEQRRNLLNNKFAQVDLQLGKDHKKLQEATNSLDFNNHNETKDIYHYGINRLTVFMIQASLLLAQKEKLEQENQKLRAKLNSYEQFVYGRQIEGVPNNPPGGIIMKPKVKRSRSCER